jgi:hypothetical protein
MSVDRPRKTIGRALSGFSSQELLKFRQEVSGIAQDLGDSASQDSFARAVDEAIGEYRLYEDAAASDQIGRKSAQTIEKSAKSLAKALVELDRPTASLLVQKLWLSRSRRRAQRAAISVDVLDNDVKRLRMISAAAATLVKGGVTVRTEALVGDIARGYADCFKATPSYSRSGVFGRLVKEAFRAGKITPVPDESRLKSALSGMKFLDAAPPRRGRKAKLNTTKSK